MTTFSLIPRSLYRGVVYCDVYIMTGVIGCSDKIDFKAKFRVYIMRKGKGAPAVLEWN